jgi:fermentation-respiration switch protein FrsA (DUF1100 family)
MCFECLRSTFLFLGYGYLGIISLTSFMQRKLQYFPDHREYQTGNPDNYLHFNACASDGVTLKGIYLPRIDCGDFSSLTILHLHGNAGNIYHRLTWATNLQQKFGCGVVLMDYRGFGGSAGFISEQGLILDAIAGVEWIAKNLSGAHKIVLHLESIGSAVGLNALSKFDSTIKGCVIEGGLTSCVELAEYLFPFLPIKYLMKDRWAGTCKSAQEFGNNIPFLSMHGALDQIVPSSFGRSLFNSVGSPDKIFRFFPRGGHNDLMFHPGYFHALKKFYSNLNILHSEDGTILDDILIE